MMRRSPIFSDLEEGHLLDLSRIAVERDVKTGQFLYFEGEPAQHLYLVASGILKLVRHSTSGATFITAIHGQGEILRSTNLFVRRRHSSSAQAIVNTSVLSIDPGDLIAFFRQHPPLGVEILGKLLTEAGRRRRAALVRISELASERTEYRLARVLLTLSLGLGATIPLTRREIAEMTGTTTETAARFISQLARRGIVQSFRGKVVVIDRSRLRQLAEVSREQGRRPSRREPMGQLK
ncbi:MAG: Crp/Fnr family transcriptional regulator [Chloroflexi bacterium]|nr:Crp/Fnr family transcriptional regulator [Chloroflexota bacterium]